MTEFLINYGLFLAKTATIVAAIAVVTVFFAFMASKKQAGKKEFIEIRRLNKKYDDMAMMMNASMLHKEGFKKYLKDEKEKLKEIVKSIKNGSQKKRIYVLNFYGDIRATAVSSLREEITAILTVATENDEVFVRLESGGGVVHGYGLGASQLMRIREKNIPLTVSVDKVAASGGYMMACVGNRIMAAPFSIIGSIGVIAQIPNFNKVLKKHNIEYEQFTAGEFKRTVTMFGENTDEAKTKFREEIEDIHLLFKDFIVQHRPDVDIVKVSTGESWPGTRALEKKLVDELKTSDDYLLESSQDADIYEIKYVHKKSLGERMAFQIQRLFDKAQYG
ncbi:inner membrane peptidase. Serine peptidase. MEROPS family S49 [Nitrosomonas aestuarii]|uniref:Inner membrane peptidase. Serine peptidase. MEROPS family S49 n=1 Tax=Nitrosomonas aestuarii TaxID=52441 RepID=A0A1I4GKT5_9PROT|nr:protease SohB [Nitrosomonas aestuarii]SFL29977.1 inner membrane peptidase. Serine peptidase. MEROPS family S49 [Nitrosomonas aestuarii]